MSCADYEESEEIAGVHWSFYAIIMAAMRQATASNLAKLKEEWPSTYEEFTQRERDRIYKGRR